MHKYLAIFLVIFLLTGCEQLHQIDNALYQVSEHVTKEDIVTGKKELNLKTRKEQITSGNEVFKEIISKLEKKGLPYNEALDKTAYARITRIFNKVHSVSHLRDEEWKPILIPDESFNAFTTGGTYIAINSVLEKELNDDNQLAAVIAHEIAHTVAGHSSEMRSFLLLNILGGSSSVEKEGFVEAFGRKKEEEADKIGIIYLALSGFDPLAASQIWGDKLNQTGSSASYPSTHPNHLDRELTNRDNANKALKYYTEGVINPDFVNLLDSNALWEKNKSEQGIAAGSGGGVLALLESYGNAVSQKAEAKTEQYKKEAEKMRIKNASSSFALLNSTPINQNSWGIQMSYSGYSAYKNMIWRGVFIDTSGNPLIVISKKPEIIQRNDSFTVVFSHPELDINNQHKDYIKLSLDYIDYAPSSTSKFTTAKSNVPNTEKAQKTIQRMRIEGASPYFKVLYSAPISQNNWGLQMHYSGYIIRKNMQWKGEFIGKNGQPLTVMSKHPKAVKHNDSFVLIFSHPELNVYQQNKNFVKVSLDSIEDTPYISTPDRRH